MLKNIYMSFILTSILNYASYIHIQCNINTYLRYSHKAQEPIYLYFCTNKDYNIVILFFTFTISIVIYCDITIFKSAKLIKII